MFNLSDLAKTLPDANPVAAAPRAPATQGAMQGRAVSRPVTPEVLLSAQLVKDAFPFPIEIAGIVADYAPNLVADALHGTRNNEELLELATRYRDIPPAPESLDLSCRTTLNDATIITIVGTIFPGIRELNISSCPNMGRDFINALKKQKIQESWPRIFRF